MNEIALRPPLFSSRKKSARARKFLSERSSAFWGYTALILFVCIGWAARNVGLVNPEEGIGYWLGIIGGSMMLALLLYPLRKRVRILSILGSTKGWFRSHMIMGLIGPLLILYHCNFQLGSFNSRVALWCMLLVAGSGVIGRHFYTRIHRGLYGRKTSLDELQQELISSMKNSHGLATILPGLVSRLDSLSTELKGHQITQSVGVGRSLNWTFTHPFVRLSLILAARKELKIAARKSKTIARDYKRLRKTSSKYIGEYTNLMGRVAQFSFYERLFSLWHVLHLPVFIMMILSALAHVLAVHMY